MKGQIMIQNGKKYVSCTISREPFIIWFLFVVHKCKMMIIYRVFFNFFKILIFQVVSGVKGQKMAQKFCLLCSISQEAYIIWPWFLEHVWSDDIFRCFFQFFKIWFFRSLGGSKRAKKDSKLQKSMSVVFGRRVKWWYLQQFCSFFKISDFSGF